MQSTKLRIIWRITKTRYILWFTFVSFRLAFSIITPVIHDNKMPRRSTVLTFLFQTYCSGHTFTYLSTSTFNNTATTRSMLWWQPEILNLWCQMSTLVLHNALGHTSTCIYFWAISHITLKPTSLVRLTKAPPFFPSRSFFIFYLCTWHHLVHNWPDCSPSTDGGR